MLHAGSDLSRRRLDVCLIGDEGDVIGRLAAPPDADGLRHLVERVVRTRRPAGASASRVPLSRLPEGSTLLVLL